MVLPMSSIKLPLCYYAFLLFFTHSHSLFSVNIELTPFANLFLPFFHSFSSSPFSLYLPLSLSRKWEAVCTSLMQRSSELLVSSVRLQHPPSPKHISNQYPANHAGRGAAESTVVHACRKEETVCHCTLLSLSCSRSRSLSLSALMRHMK